MPYSANVFNVMIVSPSDVPTERQNIREVIHDWNAMHAEDKRIVLLPTGYESHASPRMGQRAQEVINEQVLVKADLVIAVFWTRLGSPTGDSPSGSVEEINKHIEAGKPAMIYFSNAPVRPDSVDEQQYKKLSLFRKECKDRGLIEEYESISEFRDKIYRHLHQTVIREFVSSSNSDEMAAHQNPATHLPALSEDGKELLTTAALDQHGTVVRLKVLSGTVISTNQRTFAEGGNARSEAKWEAAIKELVHLGLLEDQGYKGEMFAVTHEGYKVADRISDLK